jgi:D-beta-D-heptose 7-phosphate kinase/D-beta-D-heptose 1-phosphate adenosyltransferase
MKTVIVNGTFDILHPGHIAMLNTARSLGDYLIVCIDTDRRVKELKGDKRPINDQIFRRTMLQNLKAVDIVEFFDSKEDLIRLFNLYKPDIMVKGSDWKGKSVVAEQYVKEIFWYDRIDEYSTTKIIQSIISTITAVISIVHNAKANTSKNKSK